MPIIKIKQLQFSYPEARQAIISIANWQLEAGEQVLLHGRSGSGKSTLLNVLSGLLKPQSGRIEIFGQDIYQLKQSQRDRFRAKHMAYIFQQFNLIPYLSALDNIELGSYFSGSKDALKAAAGEQLLARLNLPSTLWQKPVAELSVGQQQRVAICRALHNQPKLLLADEPSSALDPKNRDDFIALLKQLTQEINCSLILVSHDEALAKHFDQQLSLQQLNQQESKPCF